MAKIVDQERCAFAPTRTAHNQNVAVISKTDWIGVPINGAAEPKLARTERKQFSDTLRINPLSRCYSIVHAISGFEKSEVVSRYSRGNLGGVEGHKTATANIL
ncbi:hypothetical protein [Rhodopirellula bahusiensis]|uniref:hypothetical protein n=1 Tax=Rhodopirellula bahusiensis TaxID=2014065 RepID=UPI0032656B83